MPDQQQVSINEYIKVLKIIHRGCEGFGVCVCVSVCVCMCIPRGLFANRICFFVVCLFAFSQILTTAIEPSPPYSYNHHLHIHIQQPHSANCSSTSGVCAPVGGR